MLIKDLINLKSFDPVINLNWAGKINEQERLLANYIMTEDLAEIFVDMLESITMVRSSERRKKLQDINNSIKRAHILSGQYGTGKSYFLLMLNIVLEMKNSYLAEELINRFSDFPELQYQLNLIRDQKKYFLVRINGENENEKEFKDVIQAEVTKALENEFTDVSLTSVYKETTESFNKIVISNRNRIEDFLLTKNYTIRDVEANLFHHKREGIRQFEEVAKEVVGFVPKIELDKLEDFLKDANEVLKEKGYDELIIIFDEFSAYINASMENNRLHKDLGQVQNIAQLTSKSTDIDISFVASTHTDIVQMIGKYDTSKKDMLDKVFGRFEGHVLTFDQGEELLKSTIQIKDKSAVNNLFNKYQNFISETEEKFDRKLMDFYPLHPATASFLEPISNQYAQKTRTTFTFLEEVIRRKFYSEPIEKDGKINLITLSDLYDYFEKEIEKESESLVKEFNQIYNEVRDDKDLIDYAKALVLAYSNSQVKSNNKTEFTASDFASLYQKSSEEEVERKLGHIASTNHINIQKINGKYRMFVNTSGVNIESLLNEEKVKINPNFVRDKILSKSEDRIFIKKSYSLKYNMGLYPMDRTLTGEIYTVNALKQMGRKAIVGKKADKDGKIFFVIPNFDEDYRPNEIIDEYRTAMNGLEDNVCLAIPKDIVFNQNELIEYGALLNLENGNESIAKNEDIKKLVVQRRRKLEDKIRNKYLRKFSNLRNFTFVFSNGKIKDDLRQDIALYKELLYTHYSRFPHEIRVENFNMRTPLNKLVKLFLDGNAEVAKKNRTSEEAKNIYATLKPLDLIEITEKVNTESIEFKAPSEAISSLSKEIMDIVETKEDELSIGEKYIKLGSAPYGLNLPLIDLYFFISSKLGRTYIINKSNKRPFSLDEGSLKKLSEKSQDYEMKKNEIVYIPQKVADVWKALGRISGIRSEAKKVKVNVKNDFNVEVTIGKEMVDIHRIISEKEIQLTSYGIKTGKLKTLSNKLYSIGKQVDLQKKFEELELLPSLFRNTTYEENIEALRENIKKYNALKKSEINKIYSIKEVISNLEYKIENLEGYNDFKSTLKDVKENFESYKDDYLNLELLDSIDDKAKNLKLSYYTEFKRKHNDYYDKYQGLKVKLENEERGKIESIKAFENLKFKNISSIKPFLEELENFERCDCYEVGGEIKCDCKVDSLEKAESELKTLEEKFSKKKAHLSGIFQRYQSSLKDIQYDFEDNDNFFDLIINIREIESGNYGPTEEVVENVFLIKEELNNYLENIKKPITKSIEIEKIEEELAENIMILGKNEITLNEFNDKIEQILEKYKSEGYEGIKISHE